jgi:hypothetical protein
MAGRSGASFRGCGKFRWLELSKFDVILSEAKNLSVNWAWIEERFFAALRMTPIIGFFRSLFGLWIESLQARSPAGRSPRHESGSQLPEN